MQFHRPSRHQVNCCSRLLLLVLTLCLGKTAIAQTDEQIADATKFLSAQSQTVITRLSELNMLPMPVWRYHVGSLAHGEDPNLDESNWAVARRRTNEPGGGYIPGTDIPANETTWYRASIEVPRPFHGYDLTGTRIWFQFRVTGRGVLSQIIYFNGRRVAVGEDLEPIVLVENAKPGEKILVAVKLPLPEGVEVHFNVTPLKIDFSPSRPNPEELRQQFITAAALLAGEPITVEKTQLDKAISTVALQALDSTNQSAFDESLRQAQKQLKVLQPALSKFSFYATGNSHIDAAWLWPWTETVDVLRRTLGTAVQLMREYPDYTFTQSSAQYSEWIAEKYPEINSDIRNRIKEGRWEIVGGMWVEPDLNMPDGESLTRQLLIGQRYFQKAYGVTARIGWNPDSFGYTWQLPQIYKKSGIDYFVTQKLDGNDFQRLPFRLFWWQSPDGSKVLTYFPHGYGNQNLNPGRLATQLSRWRLLAPDATDLMDLYGTSDHGGGPIRAMFDDGLRWMQSDKVMPKMHFSTAQNFFNTVERKIEGESPIWNYRSVAQGFTPKPSLTEGRITVPTWNDEMYYEFHRGVMTTQANHKRNMRESEEAVLNSEKYASLAWLAGESYPGDRLTSAWKKVLFNQFHDLAAGSGIGVIFKEAAKDYEEVRCATDDITSKALETISGEVNTRAAGEVPVIVFNPLAWNRSGLVTVDVRMPAATAAGVSVVEAKNHVIPAKVLSQDKGKATYKLLLYVRDVPSMGYKVLHVVPGSKPFPSDLLTAQPQPSLPLGGSRETVKRGGAENAEIAQRITIENKNLRVTIDRLTGFITSLYNKKDDFETLAGPGNQLQTFADNPKCCDAWNIDPGTLDRPTIVSKVDSVELVENDPLRETVRVTRTWQNSKFVQDITLYASADQVKITNDIDWHEKHTLLKVAFPLAASSNFATYEIPYGTIDRPTTRNNSWEKARFEVAALRWADVGDGKHGLSLINQTKYGYDAEGNVLRLSLLRSPVSPDPNADQGHHHFTYSLYPHAGDWKQALTERRGYEYNYGLTARQVYSHDGSLPLEYSYLTVTPENVVLTAMKKAEDSDALILRVVEWGGKSGNVRINLPPGATSATVTNLMEKPEGAAIKIVNNSVTVPIHPFEILSVRADYPIR